MTKPETSDSDSNIVAKVLKRIDCSGIPCADTRDNVRNDYTDSSDISSEYPWETEQARQKSIILAKQRGQATGTTPLFTPESSSVRSGRSPRSGISRSPNSDDPNIIMRLDPGFETKIEATISSIISSEMDPAELKEASERFWPVDDDPIWGGTASFPVYPPTSAKDLLPFMPRRLTQIWKDGQLKPMSKKSVDAMIAKYKPYFRDGIDAINMACLELSILVQIFEILKNNYLN